MVDLMKIAQLSTHGFIKARQFSRGILLALCFACTDESGEVAPAGATAQAYDIESAKASDIELLEPLTSNIPESKKIGRVQVAEARDLAARIRRCGEDHPNDALGIGSVVIQFLGTTGRIDSLNPQPVAAGAALRACLKASVEDFRGTAPFPSRLTIRLGHGIRPPSGHDPAELRSRSGGDQ